MRFINGILALGLASSVSSAFAAKCETTVIAGSPKIGPMAYDTKEIKIPESCAKFKIILENKNPADMSKAAMGHNLVVVEAAKLQEVSAKSIGAGLAKDYLALGSGYLAATKLLGPGEKDTIEIETAKLKGKAFKYFCTFPGHSAIMVGDIKVTSGKVN